MRVFASLVLATFCGLSHAGGYFVTGLNLLAMLNGSEKGQAQALAFIVATHDATTSEHCTPDELTSDEMTAAVKTKLSEIGPMLGLPAVKLVESILRVDYPCKEEKAPAAAPVLKKGKLDA